MMPVRQTQTPTDLPPYIRTYIQSDTKQSGRQTDRHQAVRQAGRRAGKSNRGRETDQLDRRTLTDIRTVEYSQTITKRDRKPEHSSDENSCAERQIQKAMYTDSQTKTGVNKLVYKNKKTEVKRSTDQATDRRT